jgi:transforming growth factor-beta-induced protein
MTNKSKFLSLFAFAALAFTFTSCDDDDEPVGTTPPVGPTLNITETAIASPQYSILVGALVATDLASTLEGTGPFTVFAPDNDAFNAFFDGAGLPPGTEAERLAAAVDALGANTIRELLLYHVLGAEIRAADVPEDAYVTTLSTNSPDDDALSLRVQSNTAGVTLNNSATVEAADILATNGVIHGINEVLPMPDVVNHALNNPGAFSELTGALVAADLVETLQGVGPFTVFAPLNSAFVEISDVVATLTPEQLSTVLTYHVVAGNNIQSTEITPGAVGTVSGQEFTISVENDVVTIIDTNGDAATVVLTNVQGTNGVVHAINKVLLPQL